MISFLVFAPGCLEGVCGVSSSEYPEIDAGCATGNYVSVSHSFLFEDLTLEISVPVDMGIYEAAYNSDKSAYLYGDDKESENWSSEYYRSFIFDPSLKPFYSSLLEELREIKADLLLDSDRYAELIISYVQSIPYKTSDIRTDPKFPVETVYDNSGDCDDKSLLAAALLSLEGYDVVLFEFEEDSHMTIGIRSPDCSFMDTGYACVEVTDFSYPGWPEAGNFEKQDIKSAPFIISIDGGDIQYESCDEVLLIYDAMISSGEGAERLDEEVSVQNTRMETMLEEITILSERMNSLKNSGDISEYNRLVPVYNGMVSDYNREEEYLKTLISRHNRYADLYNLIVKKEYNRKGVYEYIVKNSVD